VPGSDACSGNEIVAALVASLRAELAESQAALARTVEEPAQARERIAELEARLRQTPRNSSKPPSNEDLDKPLPRPGRCENEPTASRAGRRAMTGRLHWVHWAAPASTPCSWSISGAAPSDGAMGILPGFEHPIIPRQVTTFRCHAPLPMTGMRRPC
jgi:hypothetical protein